MRPIGRHVEAVALLWNCHQQFPILGPQRLSDFRDALDQTVIRYMSIRPDRIHQGFFGYELPGLGRQHPQYSCGLGAKRRLCPIIRHQSFGFEIEAK